MEVAVALSLMSKVMIRCVWETWSSTIFGRKGKIKIDVRGLIKLNFKSSTDTFKLPKSRKPNCGTTILWLRYSGKAREEETARWSLPSVAVRLFTRSQRTTSQLRPLGSGALSQWVSVPLGGTWIPSLGPAPVYEQHLLPD